MSIVVYREDGFEVIDRQSLHSYLKNGWCLKRAEVPKKEAVEKETQEEETESEEDEEDEEEKPLKRLNLDELTDDEIRMTAKKLEIPYWFNKGIERLKGEISAA